MLTLKSIGLDAQATTFTIAIPGVALGIGTSSSILSTEAKASPPYSPYRIACMMDERYADDGVIARVVLI